MLYTCDVSILGINNISVMRLCKPVLYNCSIVTSLFKR